MACSQLRESRDAKCHGDAPSWMVYDGKSVYKWTMIWGSPLGIGHLLNRSGQLWHINAYHLCASQSAHLPSSCRYSRYFQASAWSTTSDSARVTFWDLNIHWIISITFSTLKADLNQAPARSPMAGDSDPPSGPSSGWREGSAPSSTGQAHRVQPVSVQRVSVPIFMRRYSEK